MGPKATADSSKDLDIGIVLAPAIGKTDWALGAFYALGDAWQAELGHMVLSR